MDSMCGGLRFIREPRTENRELRTESRKLRTENRLSAFCSRFSVLGFLFSVFCSLFSSPILAAERTILNLPHAYKDSKFQFFPIPYFETDPSAGQRYGLMPTFLWYDPDDQLITIGVATLTYNKVVGIGGFGGLFLYPSDKESAVLFFAAAQNFERDYYLQYLNERWLEERLDTEVELEYIQDPFERFFGFGPAAPKSNQSNFVSHLWFWKGRSAYEILPKFNLQLEEKWTRLTMRPRALTGLNDTQTFFAGNTEVRNSNQWLHRFSLIWNTLDNRDFPKTGHVLESFGLLSHGAFNDNDFYTGWGLKAKKIFTLQERFTTVIRFLTDQQFGNQIPFYMQTSLGGQDDLRAFVQRRFSGRGRLLFDLEERILVKHWRILKAKFDLSIDPFFSVGQVFGNWGEVEWNHLQPIGGVGFRALIPPSVVGRVDVGIGREGVEVYTTLNYPF